MDITQEIGAKIRHYRKMKGMTVEQLAAAICKSKSCVSKYEQGQIAIDIVSLYDIAAALDIRVTQLLYLPVTSMPEESTASGAVPAFFAGLDHFYLYYYDGRTNRIVHCAANIEGEIRTGVFGVEMFMNFDSYDYYQICENTYSGLLMHYGTMSALVLRNQNVEMDNYQVGIPSVHINTPTKWGLAYGISSRPLMPTSTKMLLSKTVQKETPEFEKELKISKEDIRLMKIYNMLTVM